MKNKKKNKSPGNDGFTVEFLFIFFFFGRISNITLFLLLTIFLLKRSSLYHKGMITYLPKGDKPRQFLKNWHPITLLNVLYKLMSQLKNQICYKFFDIRNPVWFHTRPMHRRKYQVRLWYNIFYWNKKYTWFTCAYRFWENFWFHKVLEYLGFGDNIITWIKILNTQIKALILQCGFLSEQFDIDRGCRQGDPIA